MTRSEERRHAYLDGAMSTRAVHAGQYPEEHNGAVSIPIYQTSTFERPVVLSGGWDYSRIANPTRSALEECLASLEGGSRATATASGMAATTTTVLATCRSGAHVVIPDNTYGGTWDLFSRLLPQWGLRYTTVAAGDLRAVRAAMEPETALVWVETPSNPNLLITDVRAVSDIAHERGALLAVDGTFASPYLQQPLGLGADIVVHSTTKYLGGHSDLTGGAIVAASSELGEVVAYACGALGTMASPMDAWLVLRGVKTLPVRMRQICESAGLVAEFLAGHPRVREVYYPGLPTHPDHDLAKRQMLDFGGVVSFLVEGDVEDAAAVCTRTKLFTLAVSLGGVESLIQHPARMTHCTTPGTSVAVSESLVRISVGLEDAGELVADLDAALAGS